MESMTYLYLCTKAAFCRPMKQVPADWPARTKREPSA